MHSFEKNVRKALIDKDMTLSALSEKLGISLAYLYDILNGARKAEKQRKRIIEFLSLDEQEV